MDNYKSYKDSGVHWIGYMPNHWTLTKFKYVSNLFTGNSLNDAQKQKYESQNPHELAYISSKDIDVNYQTVEYSNGIRIPKKDNPFKIAPKGSFLLCVEGGSAGRKMAFLNQDVCFVNKLCCFHSNQVTKFQYYFIQSQQFQDKFRLSLTGLIGGVSISALKDFELPLPSFSEQQEIVEFLDKITQKIDALIQQKERKINLLKEKRTALINRVVTKGLDPNVEMKDSGVEWAGEIPSHWTNTKMKYGIELVNEKGQPEKDDVKISPENMESNTGVCLNLYSDYEGDGMKFKKGDVLLNKLRLYLKKILYCEYDGYSLGEMIVLRTRENMISKYFYYLIFNQGLIDLLDSQSTGIKMPRVSPETILNSIIPFPPLNEQLEIVSYLDEQTQEIADLIHLEEKKIELFKEYRKSLISEVVTGKLRVCKEDLSQNITLSMKA